MTQLRFPTTGKGRPLLWLGLGAAVLFSFGAWRIAAGGEDREREARGAPAQQRAAVVDGATILTVDPDDQRRSGIETAALQPTRAAGKVEAYVTVLDVGPLADLTTADANARSQLEAARAKLAASSAAYQRAKSLYRDDQTTSLAQLQSAEAAYRADQASYAAASAQVRSAAASLRLQFGPVIGAAPKGPLVESFLQQRAVLLQVAPPAARLATLPPRLTVQDDQGVAADARYISPAVRADPKIQTQSYYYVAAATPRLAAGLTLTAQWPAGEAQDGVMVPAGAIVMWQGQSWVYVRLGAKTFRREPAATDLPVPGGYLVRTLSPDAEVVVSGAPLLLSEEARPAKRAGGQEEDAD